MPRLLHDQLLRCPSTGVAAKSLPMYIRSSWGQDKQLSQALVADSSTWRPQGISVTNWAHFFHYPLVWLMMEKYPLNLWFQESSQNPINVLVEETEQQPTYLFFVNILPWQDVYCREKPALKPHWKPSRSTFFRKWAECIQNAEKIHIQIKNGDESKRVISNRHVALAWYLGMRSGRTELHVTRILIRVSIAHR